MKRIRIIALALLCLMPPMERLSGQDIDPTLSLEEKKAAIRAKFKAQGDERVKRDQEALKHQARYAERSKSRAQMRKLEFSALAKIVDVRSDGIIVDLHKYGITSFDPLVYDAREQIPGGYFVNSGVPPGIGKGGLFKIKFYNFGEYKDVDGYRLHLLHVDEDGALASYEATNKASSARELWGVTQLWINAHRPDDR